MSDLLKDYATKGTKILTDTKTPRQTLARGKALPEPKHTPPDSHDPHQMAIRRFIKEKPAKKHLVEFFEKVIEAEERLL